MSNNLFEKWEYQIQQAGGDWITVNSSTHETDQSAALKLNQMERQYKNQNKRIRLLHNGILYDLR